MHYTPCSWAHQGWVETKRLLNFRENAKFREFVSAAIFAKAKIVQIFSFRNHFREITRILLSFHERITFLQKQQICSNCLMYLSQSYTYFRGNFQKNKLFPLFRQHFRNFHIYFCKQIFGKMKMFKNNEMFRKLALSRNNKNKKFG
jgi:hypothetical protein